VNLLQYWWVGALGIGALAVYLVIVNWRKLAAWALEAAYKAGKSEGYAHANAEQKDKQAEAVQRADDAREAASAVTELTDAEAIDLATRPPPRKR